MSNDKTAATMRRLMLVAPLGSLFITLSFPALINLYFASMAGLTALQMYAFTLPSVKRFFDIPVDDDTNNTGTTTSTTPSVKSVFASLSSASASKIREREMFGKLSLDRSLRELESLRKSVEAVDLVDPTTRSIASSSSSSSHHKNSKSIHKNKKNRN